MTNKARTRNFAPDLKPEEKETLEKAMYGLAIAKGGIPDSMIDQVPAVYASDDEGKEDGFYVDEVG